MTFPILYRDRWLCAIDKPAGIMVHRSRQGTDREFVVQRLRDQLDRHVWPVHRLDRATSGVLLFALDRETAGRLGRQFMNQTVFKRYLAVARGWTEPAGSIDHAIMQHGRDEPRAAVTHYRRLLASEIPLALGPHATVRHSLVEVRPATGRRHQIRRHFKHISHHLIGDTTYGDGRHNRLFREVFGVHRLLLHAGLLAFNHPVTDEAISVHAPLSGGFRTMAERMIARDRS